MKRMLLSGAAALMAAAAFAAPAQAQDDVAIDAPCGGKPAIECVRDIIDVSIAQPCIASKPVTECVRDAVNRAIDEINKLGPIIGDACEIVFPSCRFPTP